MVRLVCAMRHKLAEDIAPPQSWPASYAAARGCSNPDGSVADRAAGTAERRSRQPQHRDHRDEEHGAYEVDIVHRQGQRLPRDKLVDHPQTLLRREAAMMQLLQEAGCGRRGR